MAKGKESVKVDSGLGYVFFMAYVGAVIFFIERNVGFWGDVLAFLQGAVWPAYVLYYTLSAFGVQSNFPRHRRTLKTLSGVSIATLFVVRD